MVSSRSPEVTGTSAPWAADTTWISAAQVLTVYAAITCPSAAGDLRRDNPARSTECTTTAGRKPSEAKAVACVRRGSGETPKSRRPLLTNASRFQASPSNAVATRRLSMPLRPSWFARGRRTMTSNIAYSAVPATKPVMLTSDAAWDGDIDRSVSD
jgi:hypothetical protein